MPLDFMIEVIELVLSKVMLVLFISLLWVSLFALILVNLLVHDTNRIRDKPF